MSKQTLIDDCLSKLTVMEQLIQASLPNRFDPETVSICLQTMLEMKQGAMTLASEELIHLAESVSAVLTDTTETHYVKHDVVPAILTALDAMKVTLLSWQEKSPPRESDSELITVKDIDGTEPRVWLIDITPKKAFFQYNNDVITLFQQLTALGDLDVTTDITSLPPFFDYDPEQCYITWHATLTGEVNRTDIADILSQLTTVADYQLTLQSSQQEAVISQSEASPTLEQQDGLGCQQVLSGLAAIRHELQAIDPQHAKLTQMTLNDVTERLITLTHDMQSKMLSMSMVSSDVLFQTVIDELNSGTIDKQLNGRIVGTSVVLEQTQQIQLQAIVRTLTQYIIQYHIDVEDRLILGKPVIATLSFHASLARQHLQLVIIDDGCGQSSNEQAAQETMTELESTINALSGTITIGHQLGERSQHMMTFPIAQTLLEGQIVTIADHQYIVPLTSILATITYDNKEIDRVVAQDDVYLFEDEYLPVIRLKEVLGLDGDGISDVVMVVDVEGTRAAFLITDVLSQQTVMMKNLETHYQFVSGIAGAAVLEEGHVLLVLDLLTLMTPNTSSQGDRESP